MALDCNVTEVFFEELKRMCDKFNSTCVGCKIYDICLDTGCYGFIKDDTQQAIEIVQEWSDENPPKTRQNMFLELFPDAKTIHGVIDICPKIVDMEIRCLKELPCDDCIREYWLEEVE